MDDSKKVRVVFEFDRKDYDNVLFLLGAADHKINEIEKIKALVAWYKDFESDHNFIIDVIITAVSDEEIEKINGRE